MKVRPALWGVVMAVAVIWPQDLRPPVRVKAAQIPSQLEEEIADVCIRVIRDSSLYEEGWDTLSQPQFWRAAMHLDPEVILVNFAANRQIVDTLSLSGWQQFSDKQKKAYEDSLRKEFDLGKKDEIYFTTGRSHFYRYESILRHIDRSLTMFAEEGVDPWFAQAILLIESPGRLQYSTDGAYGAFQLMKGVAKDMGLTINDTIDERENLEASAKGAARLIHRVCLPKTRDILNRYGLEYEESDTWFKLMVLHVYHAGARNVERVIRKINPKEGGAELITELWQTKGRRFGNASQNYSQIILAAFMEIDELLERKGILCPPKVISHSALRGVSPEVLEKSMWAEYGEYE